MRYGALAAGLFVGYSTHRAYYAEHQKHEEHEKKHNAVVMKAEELWNEHVAKETGLSFDPNAKNFDLEKVMQYASNQK